jgi:hypothetical protein
MEFKVVTAITAYQRYTVEADTAEEAEKQWRADSEDCEVLDYGDDEHVIDVKAIR